MEEGDLGLASALVKVWNPLEMDNVQSPLSLSPCLSTSLPPSFPPFCFFIETGFLCVTALAILELTF